MPKNVDILRAYISDLHCGSNYALFLDRTWHGMKELNHMPTSGQIEIGKHKDKYCQEVRQARKDKRLQLIIDGDVIDGNHHDSGDVCTQNTKEQAEIAEEVITGMQKLMGWQRGDELYMTKGTYVHVGDWENVIARNLNAIPQSADFYSWDELRLETNGVLAWVQHHGPSAGKGANEGNPVKNFLKSIHEDCEKDGERTPDIVVWAHVHNPTYQPHSYRHGQNWRTMQGFILPSWQRKTKYALEKAPVSRNKIGGVYQTITADGIVSTPRFCVMGYE